MHKNRTHRVREYNDKLVYVQLFSFSKKNMSRKLASVCVVETLLPIPGADKIEVAKIKGWFVVVKKGEFQQG